MENWQIDESVSLIHKKISIILHREKPVTFIEFIS